ncbi:DUF222 domain-containing protein [Sinomonas sp. JGH33]|uniref:DUF222 domain-containing protein n=1 Tax=Sinomonas terricola TaxID=3110330 RepID=A0ABU5T4W9_9MICC|nr:DUF222 domain-containing protein [Sinomonas sp. JGH33]MEA5454559.1 DUF222 domain-containing protein [Sinomonas sp. JGH33]
MAGTASDDAAGAPVPVVAFDGGQGSVVDGLLRIPSPECLGASEALELLGALDRLMAWGSAIRMRAMARFAEAMADEPLFRRARQPSRLGGNEARALAVVEVATATAVSEHAAARQLNDAEDLCTSQRSVLAALEAGEFSEAHVRVILDAARTVPAEDAPHFARAALVRAVTRGGRRRTPGELRILLRRMRERVHPESIVVRKKAALSGRGVWFAPDADGMCTLEARLPAEAGLAIYNGLDTAARAARVHGATETLDQLRADSLAAQLLDDGTRSTTAFRPEIVVTIPVHTLLGGTDHAASATGQSPGRFAAELAGYGPIDTSTARQLAALAENWQRLYIDAATGHALGVGRTAYRPPKALRRYLAHRDGTCRFPSCTRPAHRCEPDHTTEWQDGGTTDPHNLALLCPRHHALKSIGAWTYTNSDHGSLHWRSPLGRAHRTEPTQHSTPAQSLAATPKSVQRLTEDDRPPPF